MIDAVYGTPVRISATGVIAKGGGRLLGVLCNASTSLTITLYDNNSSATGTPFANAIGLAAGQYLPIPAAYANGLWCVIGGIGDATFFVN